MVTQPLDSAAGAVSNRTTAKKADVKAINNTATINSATKIPVMAAAK